MASRLYRTTLPLYLAVENLEYLQTLDTIELFGEDAVGR